MSARVVATPGYGPDKQVEVEYMNATVIGSGSFGVVYSATLLSPNCKVAIKKVLQDKRFKNRELNIMRKIQHQNVVKLHYFFYSSGEKKEDLFLNLILEYMPETVYRVIKTYSKTPAKSVPIDYIKVYMYQLFRALAYVHSMGICHRDIKPQNLLVDPATGVLKLCDFGSAKNLRRGEPNVSYICSRYYRAPELIFNAVLYTTAIDMWSAGCVLAEMFLCRPIFPGDTSLDQLVEIIKIIGTPTKSQIQAMNPGYTDYNFPVIKAANMSNVIRGTSGDAVLLCCALLRYNGAERLGGLEACVHPFFDSLRQPNASLPNRTPLPPLFNFTYHELGIQPNVNSKLLSHHNQEKLSAGGTSTTTTANSSPVANL